MILAAGARRLPCEIHDLSRFGARISPVPDVDIPDNFTLEVPRRHINEEVCVVRRGEHDLGVEFKNAI